MSLIKKKPSIKLQSKDYYYYYFNICIIIIIVKHFFWIDSYIQFYLSKKYIFINHGSEKYFSAFYNKLSTQYVTVTFSFSPPFLCL